MNEASYMMLIEQGSEYKRLPVNDKIKACRRNLTRFTGYTPKPNLRSS